VKRLASLAALLAAIAAQPAAACQYSQIPEVVGDGTAQFLAREMVRAATYVDLVLVEDDGTRPMNDATVHVLTLRSIAHLKGNGPDRFSLFGSGLTLREEAQRVFAAPLQHFTQDDGRVTPFPYNAEYQGQLFPRAVKPGVPPPPPPPPSSCGPSGLAGETGRFYVVMRGPDGRLLNNFSLYGDARHPAFAFVPVTLERDNHWLRAVLGAVSPPAAAQGPSALYLREGADAASVEASLRRAGLTPVAAYVQSGERLDEVRPSDSEVSSPWLTRAIPLVIQRNRGGLGDPDHGAAEFLRSKLGFEQVYGGLGYEVAQAYLASVRHKQRSAGATPRLVAVALSGPAESVEAAARESFADGLRPLPRTGPANLELPGQSEAARFAAMQSIERDIWLMNGGNGNRQGTLPSDR
jgi:hypothetical protein